VGGFQLPFLRKLGVDSPDFDFRIPGVTSLNADLHKFGYCALGTGVILYRTEAAHDFQPFHLDDWAMGPWHSPAMLGTRPGAAIAASWAVMRYLGNAGYIELTRTVWRTAERLMQGINLIPGLQVWGTPHMACFAYGSRIVDIHDVADEMIAKGWFVRKQAYPPSIHVVLTPPHEAVVDAYLSDLSDAVDKATR
jgi:glutamate/tyrosine decarboxylase-like PLP-dependent enzyme